MCGQVLVDIGAGVQDWGLKFAEAAGASAYIAVEPRFAGDLFDALELHQKSKSGTMIPASIVCDDGLHCLQALGSDSVSILMAGMDSFVVRGFLGFPADWEYDEYLGEWAVGIERVLHPYGGYLNCSSVFYPRNLCRFPSRSEDDSLYAKRPFSQA